jgi:hypothetical protein
MGGSVLSEDSFFAACRAFTAHSATLGAKTVSETNALEKVDMRGG